MAQRKLILDSTEFEQIVTNMIWHASIAYQSYLEETDKQLAEFIYNGYKTLIERANEVARQTKLGSEFISKIHPR